MRRSHLLAPGLAIEMADAALEIMDYPAARNTKAKAYAYKGYNLFKKGKLDEAKEQLDLAFEASKYEELAHYAMGLCLRDIAVRDHDRTALRKAKSHFERALALEPDYKRVKTALAEHVEYEKKVGEE